MLLPPAGAGVGALALLLLPGLGQTPAPSWQARAGFALQLPAGWSVLREAPDRGMVLKPPLDRPWPVELVVWPVSVGITTADQAAREHERVLVSRFPYARVRSEALPAPGGGEGVYVEGSVTFPEGRQVTALFVAFLSGTRGYVIGTFAEPGDSAEARRDCLDPLVRGLSFVALSARAAPRPRVDSRPRPAPEPRGSAPSPAGSRPPPRPATSAPAPRKPASAAPVATIEGDLYAHPAGFSLRLPPEWRCEVAGHAVQLLAPNGGVACLLPVISSGSKVGALVAEEAVRLALGDLARRGQLTVQPCPGDGGAAWCAVTLETDGGKLAGAFSFVLEGANGLVAGVLVPETGSSAAVPLGARAIASFQARLAPAPRPEPGAAAAWTDPPGKLTCDAPAGWLLRGGAAAYDGKPVIDLQGQAASGSGAWFAWSQPTRPTFRDLAPVLRQSGFRDGDPYYAAGGGERRMVLARASAADFVARYLLPRALLPLPATASPVQVAAPSVSLLGLADETAGLVDVVGESRGETRWGVCLASAGSAAGASSDGFWQAAYLAFGGGPGGRTAAGLALRDVVRSARATGEGSAASIEKAPLAALLEAASAAMAAEFWEPLLGDVAFAPALDVRRARVPGPAAYSTPASALALWRDVAAGRAQGCEALTPSRGAAQ